MSTSELTKCIYQDDNASKRKSVLIGFFKGHVYKAEIRGLAPPPFDDVSSWRDSAFTFNHTFVGLEVERLQLE